MGCSARAIGRRAKGGGAVDYVTRIDELLNLEIGAPGPLFQRRIGERGPPGWYPGRGRTARLPGAPATLGGRGHRRPASGWLTTTAAGGLAREGRRGAIAHRQAA